MKFHLIINDSAVKRKVEYKAMIHFDNLFKEDTTLWKSKKRKQSAEGNDNI